MKENIEALSVALLFFGGVFLIAYGLNKLSHPLALIWTGACMAWFGTRVASR